MVVRGLRPYQKSPREVRGHVEEDFRKEYDCSGKDSSKDISPHDSSKDIRS
jgi:hypothetical protein